MMDQDHTMLSRSGHSGPPDKMELRGLAPTDLVVALDAIALSRDLDRTSLVNLILLAEVRRIGHELKILNRMARGNPLLSDADGGAAE